MRASGNITHVLVRVEGLDVDEDLVVDVDVQRPDKSILTAASLIGFPICSASS